MNNDALKGTQNKKYVAKKVSLSNYLMYVLLLSTPSGSSRIWTTDLD